MRVIITGGTGLIGLWLARALAHSHQYEQNEIVVLTRDPATSARKFSGHGLVDVKSVGWDGHTAQGWGHLITGDSAIVNLAGANPAHWRWTKAYRARILESRLRAGESVTRAIDRYGPPAVLLQSSAGGYYGDRGQEVLTETSLPGQGFRADVCRAWELSTAQTNTRRCILRTGIVLDRNAGAFPPLLRFARMFGRQLGNGQQWIPWIHPVDVARAIQFLIENRTASGPFNLCAPEPVTNRDLIRAVQRVIKRPALLPVPAFVLRLMLGEMSTTVLDSQRIMPRRLLDLKFEFEYLRIDLALGPLLRD
jgi:uncharacterized protein